MSGQVHQRHARYLGIINGIVFRIDSTVDSSGSSLELVSLEIGSVAGRKGYAAAQTIAPPAPHAERPLSPDASDVEADSSGDPFGAEETVDEAPGGKSESAAKPFARDGVEPLRAGHPDLWNLLVAGTCLEGSTFRSV
jgi:hypothetical protein